jgi:hypothetical protein
MGNLSAGCIPLSTWSDAIDRPYIALGESLGIDVIAEGVETEGQRRFLALHGCHAYQGFLFGRPGPIEDLLRMARAEPVPRTVHSPILFREEAGSLGKTTAIKSRMGTVGVTLPSEVLAPDVIASLIRMSGGNFRLLTRLLTQIERILKVNQLDKVSKEIVAAARNSLVIGQV